MKYCMNEKLVKQALKANPKKVPFLKNLKTVSKFSDLQYLHHEFESI